MKNREIESFYPRFLKVREVALFCGIGVSTVWRKVANGEFPKPVKISPGTTRWRYEDLEAWAQDPTAWEEKRGGIL